MKPFTRIASVIFGIVSIAHLLRLLFNWSVLFGSEKEVTYLAVPHWVSIFGFLFAALLCVMLWREGKR